MPDGTIIHCSSWFGRPRTIDWYWPEVGLFFASSWANGAYGWTTQEWKGPEISPNREIAIVNWADRGLPASETKTVAALEYGLEQAKSGRFVEIGCIGGHGRTGTALAIMLVIGGMSHKDAKKFVWKNYCTKAIESLSQEKFIAHVDEKYNNAVIDYSEFLPKPYVYKPSSTTTAGKYSGKRWIWSAKESKLIEVVGSEYTGPKKWNQELQQWTPVDYTKSSTPGVNKDRKIESDRKESVPKDSDLVKEIDAVIQEYEAAILAGDDVLSIKDLDFLEDCAKDVKTGAMNRRSFDEILKALLDNAQTRKDLVDDYQAQFDYSGEI